MPAALRSVIDPVQHDRTTAPIKVLIVDDSVVARTVLARMIGDCTDFQVAGQAGGAVAALAMLDAIEVDIILLDLQMPGLDGFAALPALIARSGGAHVLIVSSACSDNGATTLTALAQGATDTLLKPAAAAMTGRFADELMDRMRRIARQPRAAAPPPRLQARTPGLDNPLVRRLECVGIGASTGGVHALASFFSALPEEFSAPILITQHLPAPFMPYFAAQLADMARRPTRVAVAGMQPVPSEILLAPGDAHLTLARMGGIAHVRLERRRAASGCLPSVDPMFASIGRVYGAAGIGIMLSGMGRDGAVGARALVDAGGVLLAQDAGTSVVWGMPGVVANAGLARAVLPPDAIARRIAAWNAQCNDGSTDRWT